jgi:NADH-quinone oxidoreductase subunit N
MRSEGIAGDTLADMKGLIHRSPGYAIWMLIFLVSLAGIPPAAGFLGKYYIFLSLIETGHYSLAVVGALYAAVALYYYFRIVRFMFLAEEDDKRVLPAPIQSLGFRGALLVTGVLTLVIGIYPEPFLKFARIVPGGGGITENIPAVRVVKGG